MEVSFEEEFPSTQVHLSPELRKQFYEKLKHLVVVIDTEVNLGDTKQGQVKYGGVDEPDEQIKSICGGGVLMNEKGFVLTCAHIVPQEGDICFRTVHERGEPTDDPFIRAELVYRDQGLDLAVLKPKDDQRCIFNFSKFGCVEDIQVGMQVLAIAHPRHLYYSMLVGEVTFPCEQGGINSNNRPVFKTPTCRIVGGVRREGIDTDFSDYREDLEVIQMSNVHGSGGASGAPVFDSRGRVIGIYSFVVGDFDFAVNVRVLKQFWTISLSRLPPSEKEKVGGGKEERQREKKHKAKQRRR